MKTNSVWVWLTIAAIWVAVAIMSISSPDLVFGDEPGVIRFAAVIDWVWGIVATVGVLRLTLFRRPNEVGWGQDTAWPWILGVVGGLWAAATVVSVGISSFEIGDSISVPAAAIIAPLVAAMLTWYVCEFLIAGFAARRGGPL